MARQRRQRNQEQVGDYRHDKARRKNNPPAGIASTYEVRERKTQAYAYDPHLDPQLQWAGKTEHTSFEVDVVSLHIHERISTRAILDAVRRPAPLQLSLFGETPLPLDQQIEFYQHEVGWANRLILGDSLLVMNSLLVKEGMAGKVQMIYVDPPYGIKYSSNFQPRVDKRDVKDQDEDLTREPEQIKAYRDTWKLGTHSYLTYLRDRLLLARELLAESGSVFVQINDENLHLVRGLLDEVFGRENFVALVAFRKFGIRASRFLDNVVDYLLWYAKNREATKYRQLFVPSQRAVESEFEPVRLYRTGGSPGGAFLYSFEGRSYKPSANLHWATGTKGLNRLGHAERLIGFKSDVRYKRCFSDFPYSVITTTWDDTWGEQEKLYAVQTATRAVERCILMTTDPGDLVFDPTCVRRGTRVWRAAAPSPALPVNGEGVLVLASAWRDHTPVPPPFTGEVRRGAAPSTGEARRGAPSSGEPLLLEAPQAELIPIERIRPGDLVWGHDGKPHRVLRVIGKAYRGSMIGIRRALGSAVLWLTGEHLVLCKTRPRTLGGQRDWSASPLAHLERRRQLRREASLAERRLWSALRKSQLGSKFRRQHPIGPYIADFYSREAHLVVEVDGSAHFDAQASEYDRERDAYMRALGLAVLRFSTSEVEANLDGVCLAIGHQCHVQEESVEGAEWVQAGALQPGDLVFVGLERQAASVESVEVVHSKEQVYDLEVEGCHSFLTEVCAVHNCGSGTTAYCAEKWGRRWITCDTSRVALAIARQRLMTAKLDYYEVAPSPALPVDGEGACPPTPAVNGEGACSPTPTVKREGACSPTLPVNREGACPPTLPVNGEGANNPARGFIYQTVPHITLESIAHNVEIDGIAAKYQPQIDEALASLNEVIGQRWMEWEVPRDAEQTWPSQAREHHDLFWSLKHKKRQESDASIQRNAPQEALYDRPKVKRRVVRVTGPFTVEAIPVPAVEDPTQAPIPQFEEQEARARISDRGGDYLTTMLTLLKQQGGVVFPGGKKMELQNLRLLNVGMLHAEGESPLPTSPVHGGGIAGPKGRRIAISFGPQYGPVTAMQVAEAIPTARNNAYDVLILAGFSFDPEAQAFAQRAPVRGLEVHFANVAPDVLVGDLLKTTRASQVFTVFGQPDVRVSPSPSVGKAGAASPSPSTGRARVEDTYTVELRGVDVYDPLTGETQHTRGTDVAGWFLDTDYDGMTIHICQAFFPGDADAWEKLQRALKASIDPEAFEQMRGTTSFPFEPGKHRRIAVKVVDFRGNEVVRLMNLGEGAS